MALSGVRTNVFNENYLNESEQDANSVLAELDKGLRATNVGVQCEAIVRFPRLFEKYPFPILINSSFLKLSDFFVNGSNLLRYWILRVCQQSENHMDKIVNIDAFLMRIFTVMHTNDPIARALTLRTLGAISRVISEKQKVHHAIRSALDSHDGVEVEAAIFASGQFAAQSKSFAISMCAKISDMIESLLIPLSMKLHLIPVLRHMHHDSNTAAMVKDLCLNLLPKYPAESFVISIIDNLTQLTARTLCGITEHIELLLDFLNDTRDSVRSQTLKSLKLLTQEESVHAWSKTAIGNIIDKAQTCEDPQEQYHFLHLIQTLTLSPLTCHVLLTEQRKQVHDLCLNCISSVYDLKLATEALTILTGLVTYNGIKKLDVTEFMHIINMQTEGLLFLVIFKDNYDLVIQKVLDCGIKIAMVDNGFGTEFVCLVANLLGEDMSFPLPNIILLCKTLGKLGEHFQLQNFEEKRKQIDEEGRKEVEETTVMEEEQSSKTQLNPVSERLPILLRILNDILDGEIVEERLQVVEILTAVMLQSTIGYFLPVEIIEFFDKCSTKTNCWTMFRLARSCSRYGQHYLAANIYSKIAKVVHLDRMYFFFLGMSQIGKAECVLNFGVDYEVIEQNYAAFEEHLKAPESEGGEIKRSKLLDRLQTAKNLYWQANTNFRACSSTAHGMTFQLEYIKLRAHFLQTLQTAVTVKHAQLIVPPPAIASSLAQTSRDHLQKYGYVTNQLRKLVKAMKGCQEEFSRLYKSAFDADPLTLELIEIMEYQCALFAHTVETICYTTPPDPPSFLPKGGCPENSNLVTCCHRMEALLKRLPDETGANKTIGCRHLDVVIAMTDLIVKTPQCLPRYFFQMQQSTHIKLSISPQPRAAGEPVIVQSGSNLVIKVEGVIQHFGRQRALFRDIDTVQLTLNSQLVTPRTSDIQKLSSPDSVTLSQTIKPQRDFFSCSFLLPMSSGGQWQVTLETFIIDETGFTWSTGPKNTMTVRMLDDTTKPTTAPPAQAGQTRRF